MAWAERAPNTPERMPQPMNPAIIAKMLPILKPPDPPMENPAMPKPKKKTKIPTPNTMARAFWEEAYARIFGWMILSSLSGEMTISLFCPLKFMISLLVPGGTV